jgi:hypothetical protein
MNKLAGNSMKTAIKSPRGKGKPFPKGVSGNPSGRPPKDPEISETLKLKSLEAVNKLIKLMDSEDERVALSAVNSFLDRALGKPVALNALEMSGPGGAPLEIAPAVDISALNDEELRLYGAIYRKAVNTGPLLP